MLGRKRSAIHREASVQAQCITWRFAYFDVSWVVHGYAQGAAPSSGRDAMEEGWETHAVFTWRTDNSCSRWPRSTPLC